jgi:hypothetical protein
VVYRGQVSGDVIVLADGMRLPDGSEVLVEPVGQKSLPVATESFTMRNGVALFPPSGADFRPDMNLVNELRDDEP